MVILKEEPHTSKEYNDPKDTSTGSNSELFSGKVISIDKYLKSQPNGEQETTETRPSLLENSINERIIACQKIIDEWRQIPAKKLSTNNIDIDSKAAEWEGEIALWEGIKGSLAAAANNGHLRQEIWDQIRNHGSKVAAELIIILKINIGN